MIYTGMQVSFVKLSCLFDMNVDSFERGYVCTTLDVLNSVQISWFMAHFIKQISNACMNNNITSSISWICKHCYVLSNLSRIVLNDRKDASRSALFHKILDAMILTWIFHLRFTISRSERFKSMNLILILNNLNSRNNDPIEHSRFNQHINCGNYQNEIIITMLLTDLFYKNSCIQVFRLYSIYVTVIVIIRIVVVADVASSDAKDNSQNVSVSSSNFVTRNDSKLGIIGSLCKKYSKIVINDPVKFGLIKYKSIGTNKTQFDITITYIEETTSHIILNNYCHDTSPSKTDYAIIPWKLERYNDLLHSRGMIISKDDKITMKYNENNHDPIGKDNYSNPNCQFIGILFSEKYDQVDIDKNCGSGSKYVIMDDGAQIHSPCTTRNEECYTLKRENTGNTETLVYDIILDNLALFWTSGLPYYYTIWSEISTDIVVLRNGQLKTYRMILIVYLEQKHNGDVGCGNTLTLCELNNDTFSGEQMKLN